MQLGTFLEEDYYDITPDPSSVNRILRNHTPSIEIPYRELIDNSLSAGADRISIYFETEEQLVMRQFCLNKQKYPMVYFDNGKGIAGKEELREALTIKENLSKKTYNVYGVGWKSTIASLAGKVTIITCPREGEMYVAQYNCAVPAWRVPIKDVKELNEEERNNCIAEWEEYSLGSKTGTLQLFEDLTIDYNYQKLENALFHNKESLAYWYHGVNEAGPFQLTLNGKELQFIDPFQRDLKETKILKEDNHTFVKKDGTKCNVKIGACETPDVHRGRKGTAKKTQKRTKFSRIVLRIDGRIIGTDLEMKVFGNYGNRKHFFSLLAIDINVSSKDFGGGDDVPIPPNKTTTNKNNFSAEFLNFLKKDCGLQKLIKDFAENRNKEDKIKISKSVENQVKDIAAAISKNAKFLPLRDALIEDRKSPVDEAKSKKQIADSKEKKRESDKERRVQTRTSKYNVNILYDKGDVPHYSFLPVGKKYEVNVFVNHPYWYYSFFDQDDEQLSAINELGVRAKLELAFAEIEKHSRSDLTTEEANVEIEKVGNFMIDLHQ